MNIVYLIYTFIVNGVKTFQSAATGHYDGESDTIGQIRDEMMNDSASDSDNLRRDWKNVERDVRVSFNQLTMSNG